MSTKGAAVCEMPECGGELDLDNIIPLQTSCTGASPCYPCKKCGRIHSAGGGRMYGRDGTAVYLKDGEIVRVEEPVSFDVGRRYVTTGWLYVSLAEASEDGVPQMVELASGVGLTFRGTEDKNFLFRDDAGTLYSLGRFDVNFVADPDSQTA